MWFLGVAQCQPQESLPKGSWLVGLHLTGPVKIMLFGAEKGTLPTVNSAVPTFSDRPSTEGQLHKTERMRSGCTSGWALP